MCILHINWCEPAFSFWYLCRRPACRKNTLTGSGQSRSGFVESRSRDAIDLAVGMIRKTFHSGFDRPRNRNSGKSPGFESFRKPKFSVVSVVRTFLTVMSFQRVFSANLWTHMTVRRQNCVFFREMERCWTFLSISFTKRAIWHF